MKLNIKSKLDSLDLTPADTVVIGSGILNALDIRESHDIDLVVTEQTYQRLKQLPHFRSLISHGREILSNGLIEINSYWFVLGRTWNFSDFLEESVVIEGVRYHTLEFLLKVKESWYEQDDNDPKTIHDIELIKKYLATKKESR